MTIINLDKNFTPFGQGINYISSTFPSGFEVNIRLPIIAEGEKVVITTRIKSSNDIFMLLLATDACKRMGVYDIDLFIPYLPYARQDRAMIEVGEMDENEPFQEALSLKVLTDILNLHSFTKVYLLDPHSDVSTALTANANKISNHCLVKKALEGKSNYLIACPDAGAEKKIVKLCRAIGYTNKVVMCEKVRDVVTGNIVSVKVHADDLGGRDVYTVDDICDGGYTYILQGQALKEKNCGNRFLIVTHGLFTKGEDVLKPVLEGVFTTDSIKDIESNFIKQYKLEHILPTIYKAQAAQV